MSDFITIRVWDDGHKELVADDAIEFEAEGEGGRLGSKNVKYYPQEKIENLECQLLSVSDNCGVQGCQTNEFLCGHNAKG